MKCPICIDIVLNENDGKKLADGKFLCWHCYHSTDKEYDEGIETCAKCGRQRKIDF